MMTAVPRCLRPISCAVRHCAMRQEREFSVALLTASRVPQDQPIAKALPRLLAGTKTLILPPKSRSQVQFLDRFRRALLPADRWPRSLRSRTPPRLGAVLPAKRALSCARSPAYSLSNSAHCRRCGARAGSSRGRHLSRPRYGRFLAAGELPRARLCDALPKPTSTRKPANRVAQDRHRYGAADMPRSGLTCARRRQQGPSSRPRCGQASPKLAAGERRFCFSTAWLRALTLCSCAGPRKPAANDRLMVEHRPASLICHHAHLKRAPNADPSARGRRTHRLRPGRTHRGRSPRRLPEARVAIDSSDTFAGPRRRSGHRALAQGDSTSLSARIVAKGHISAFDARRNHRAIWRQCRRSARAERSFQCSRGRRSGRGRSRARPDPDPQSEGTW